MLAAGAPWWMGEWGNLPHNANDNRPAGTGANADNFPQPPNTTATTGRNIPAQPKPDYTGRLPEPGYGPQKTGFINPSVGPQPRQGWGDAFPSGPLPPSTPQAPPGGWMYNKTNSTPAFNPVLPTPRAAPPAPVPQRSATGQARPAPPPASEYQAGGPGGLVNNFTPAPRNMPANNRYFPEDPRRPAPPSVPSFGPGSKPVPSPTRDSAPWDQAGGSNRKAWEAAGRPGLPTGGAFAQVIGRAQDGTAFGTQTEATFYDKWRASGGQTSAPAPPQYGPQQAAQPQAPQVAPADQYERSTQQAQGRAPAASASPRPPAPSLRTADRYTRPEGYAPNSTLWSQHTPAPEPEPAPYNPNPPRAPKPNVIPKMQMGPSSSYLSGPGSSTTATWDPAKNKMGPAYASGGMTMNANMANPGGESMRPQGFTFTAKGVDGKQYANPADAMARRDALINNLGQQQARYSGSMGRNLGAPQFNMKQAMGQGAR